MQWFGAFRAPFRRPALALSGSAPLRYQRSLSFLVLTNRLPCGRSSSHRVICPARRVPGQLTGPLTKIDLVSLREGRAGRLVLTLLTAAGPDDWAVF